MKDPNFNLSIIGSHNVYKLGSHKLALNTISFFDTFLRFVAIMGTAGKAYIYIKWSEGYKFYKSYQTK